MDVERADNDNATVCGWWTGVTPTKASTELSRLADSIGAWWGVDKSGVYRLQVLTDPTSETALLTITANDIVGKLTRLASALPTYSHHVRYRRNHTVQTSTIAGGVSDVRRGVLAQDALEVDSEDATVQSIYLLAGTQVVDTVLDTTAGATTEAARLQTLRGTRRERYAFSVGLDSVTEEIDLGSYITLTHSRFELTAGKTFVVMTVEPDALGETVALEVWG
jgi:hypothetical protein